MPEQRPRYRTAVMCILLCILTNASVGQRRSAPEIPDSEALAKRLDELIADIPKWRALIAAVNPDALPIQYKEGKTIEELRTYSLAELDEIGRFASSARQKPTASDSVQLLLALEDLYGGTLDHLASALMMMTGPDGKTIGQAVIWGQALTETDSSIMELEKRTEVPVMTMLKARDALLDICKDKIVR